MPFLERLDDETVSFSIVDACWLSVGDVGTERDGSDDGTGDGTDEFLKSF